MTKRVLILCTGNSCRSQMAERIWEQLGAGRWSASSAGSDPAGYVHPLAIQALQEMNLDVTGLESKHVDQFNDEAIDLAVTVCDNAREACPLFPNAVQTLHWPFDDPADASGTDAERMAVFRRVRDEIHAKIKSFLREGND